MDRSLPDLVETRYDLAVVGGGIFGLYVAWDAALRGLSVALVERGDFCAATSAHSFKMIHGGIRYLQHMDLARIRESCRDRRALLRTAPHLAHPLPIAVPTYAQGLERKSLLRAAFLAYDLLTLDRNRGIDDATRRIPWGCFLSRDECVDRFPGLDTKGLTGAGLFYDGQMYNPPRLGLAVLKSAVERGARAANYVEATDFLREGDRVVGVRCRDLVGDAPLEIRARVVVNAAGPWAHRIVTERLGRGLDPEPVFSRDACFVVGRRLVGDVALAVKGRTSDPDAILARGARHLFLVPWRDATLVGVWHGVHRGPPDAFTVEQQEIEAFLDEVNGAYPSLRLTLADVSRWMAGLVLFGENREGAVNLSYGKRSLLVDHARGDRLEGLITLVGVRWTTARGMAEKVVDRVFQKLGRRGPRCQTASTPVHGGDIDDFDALEERLTAERPAGLPERVLRSLAHNHGTAYRQVLSHLGEDPALGETLGDSHVLGAEVVHAVREEMAFTLADIALRRTDLATAGHPGREALEACAALAARELGWDASRRSRELEAVLAAFPTWQRDASGPGAAGADGEESPCPTLPGASEAR